MSEQIRSWQDALFYFSAASTANLREQLIKLQQASKLLRALSDASTVNTNGDKLQDILTGLSFGNSTQRHKWRMIYDTTNDRWLVQRNSGTDASKTWVEMLRIDSSGNVTTTGSLSTDALTTTAGGITLGGVLDANDFYFRNVAKIVGRTRTDSLVVHGTSEHSGAATFGAATFSGATTFLGVTKFYTESIENLSRGWVHLKTKTASSQATLDFVGLSVYPKYKVELEGVYPATDATSLLMRVSTDNGANYIAAASYATVGYVRTNFPTEGDVATSGATSFNVVGDGSNTQENSAAGSLSGTLTINSRGSATLQTRILSQVEYLNSSGVFLSRADISGAITAGAATNAIRFLFSSGNISAGTFRLYGLKVSP